MDIKVIKKPRKKRGLVMLGGSGEIRTRDQRIKRLEIVLEQ
jgi:hypothetical protein